LYRFERGVDPDLQRRALSAPASWCSKSAAARPARSPRPAREAEVFTVKLRRARLDQLLGHDCAGRVSACSSAWASACSHHRLAGSIPSHRYDLRLDKVDLIEEVARLWPATKYPARPHAAHPVPTGAERRP
jgi:phenylalanyl-tRNA synthetase beta subunit